MTSTGMKIEGLEDIPMAMKPIPWVRLVQPTSKKIELSDNSDAPVGTFYFNDTKSTTPKLEFILLRAKKGTQDFERDGVITPTPKLAILGVTADKLKPFVLSLSVTSFGSFGVLLSQMEELGITKSREYILTLTADKQENEKGKYYIARFNLARKVDEDKLAELDNLYYQYGTILDRSDPTTETPE